MVNFSVSSISILVSEYCFLFFSVLTFFIGLLFSPVSYSSRFAWSLILLSSIFTIINYTIVLNFNLKLNNCHYLYDAGLVQNFNILYIKIISLVCLSLISMVGIFITKNLFSLEFIVLLTFGEVATLFLLSFDHLLVILIFLEIQALIGYILTVYNRSSAFATEASLKYFLLGGVSSSILILSLALLQSITGSFYLSDISEVISLETFINYEVIQQQDVFKIVESTLTNNSIYNVIGFLFLFGMLFKLSAAPLHFWTPDAYEDVEFLTIGYLSTIPKLAVIGLLTSSFYFLIVKFSYLFLVVSILSLFIGSINGVYQNNIKRLLAYSTINNSSYILLLFSLSIIYLGNFNSNSYLPEDILVLSVYLQSGFYSISFIMLMGLLQLLPAGKAHFSVLGFFYYLPVSIKMLFLILVFSLAGIPPLIGFFSKSIILYNVIISNTNYLLLLLLPLFGLVSQFYYTRLVAAIFFKTTSLSLPIINKIPYNFIYFLIISGIFFNVVFSIIIFNAV